MKDKQEEYSYESDVSECPFELFTSKDQDIENQTEDLDGAETIPIYNVNGFFLFSKNVIHHCVLSFDEDVGPCHNLPSGSSEECYFGLFFNDEFYD